jgi:alcohol dehydrogenase (nicotinoprotein)
LRPATTSSRRISRRAESAATARRVIRTSATAGLYAGVGGVGINAVQGARYAEATTVVAIDPNPFKPEMATRLGATHTATSVEEARDALFHRTHGQMADLAVSTVGVLEPQTTVDAVSLIGKAGRVVVTSVSHADEKSISLTGSPMVGFHKRIQGSRRRVEPDL